MKNTIEALLAERAGYVARKLHARVAAVDAEIKRLGGNIEVASVEPEIETASASKRTKRTTN
jgi:hypothetical protein